jgi:hypothetical protein
MSLNCGLYRVYCSSPDDYESEELQWNDIIRVRPKDSKKNLSQYHFVQTPGLRGERLVTNSLSNGMTNACNIRAQVSL